jgi:hypothetical protein
MSPGGGNVDLPPMLPGPMAGLAPDLTAELAVS